MFDRRSFLKLAAATPVACQLPPSAAGEQRLEPVEVEGGKFSARDDQEFVLECSHLPGAKLVAEGMSFDYHQPVWQLYDSCDARYIAGEPVGNLFIKKLSVDNIDAESLMRGLARPPHGCVLSMRCLDLQFRFIMTRCLLQHTGTIYPARQPVVIPDAKFIFWSFAYGRDLT